VHSDDPYRIFRSAFASKTVRSAWTKSYGDQFWEALIRRYRKPRSTISSF
jgi:hypothetical protein